MRQTLGCRANHWGCHPERKATHKPLLVPTFSAANGCDWFPLWLFNDAFLVFSIDRCQQQPLNADSCRSVASRCWLTYNRQRLLPRRNPYLSLSWLVCQHHVDCPGITELGSANRVFVVASHLLQHHPYKSLATNQNVCELVDNFRILTEPKKNSKH